MKDYLIFFEFFGKKWKTIVQAKDIDQAKQIIQSKINFLKFVEKENKGPFMDDDVFEHLKDLQDDTRTT